MKSMQTADVILPNVVVPVSLIENQNGFGGIRVQDCLAGDLVVRNGRAVQLEPASASHRESRLLVVLRRRRIL